MGHTRHVIIIQEIAHLHIDRCAGLVGVWIMDQKRLEIVGQTDDTIGAIIEFWLLEMLGYMLSPAHSDSLCREGRIMRQKDGARE